MEIQAYLKHSAMSMVCNRNFIFFDEGYTYDKQNKTKSIGGIHDVTTLDSGFGFRVSMVKRACALTGGYPTCFHAPPHHSAGAPPKPWPFGFRFLWTLRPGPTTSLFQWSVHLDMATRSGEVATIDGGGAARARVSERSAGPPPVASACQYQSTVWLWD